MYCLIKRLVNTYLVRPISNVSVEMHLWSACSSMPPSFFLCTNTDSVSSFVWNYNPFLFIFSISYKQQVWLLNFERVYLLKWETQSFESKRKKHRFWKTKFPCNTLKKFHFKFLIHRERKYGEKLVEKLENFLCSEIVSWGVL